MILRRLAPAPVVIVAALATSFATRGAHAQQPAPPQPAAQQAAAQPVDPAV